MRPTSICIAVAMALISGGCSPLPSVQSGLNAINFDLNATSYVVRAGETANSIAFRYRLSTQEMIALNPGVDLQRLSPGMQINVRQPMQANTRAMQANNRLNVAEPRLGAARTSPTYRTQPQVIDGTTVSDRTLLGANNELANSLPTMRVGTYDGNAFPVEEIVSNDYQIPDQTTNQMPNQTLNQTHNDNNAALAAPANLVDIRWGWPTIGQVVRAFDPGRPNGRSIDIEGMVGQDVQAVADGQVIFAGRDPSSVGKVVIVKHFNDYISVYSHTKDLFVSTDDTVKVGDTIASLGANPDDESMLRFELRRSGKPLNPLRVLPAN